MLLFVGILGGLIHLILVAIPSPSSWRGSRGACFVKMSRHSRTNELSDVVRGLGFYCFLNPNIPTGSHFAASQLESGPRMQLSGWVKAILLNIRWSGLTVKLVPAMAFTRA